MRDYFSMLVDYMESEYAKLFDSILDNINRIKCCDTNINDSDIIIFLPQKYYFYDGCIIFGHEVKTYDGEYVVVGLKCSFKEE